MFEFYVLSFVCVSCGFCDFELGVEFRVLEFWCLEFWVCGFWVCEVWVCEVWVGLLEFWMCEV